MSIPTPIVADSAGGRRPRESQAGSPATTVPIRLRWIEAFETGNAEIDVLHRKLVEACDRLLALVEGKAAWPQVIADARVLVADCVAHFRAEEAMLERIDFSRRSDHVAEHCRIEQEMQSLIRRMEQVDGADIQRGRDAHPRLAVEGVHKYGAYRDDLEALQFARALHDLNDTHPCIEAQIMDWADDTAYSLNDIIDGVRAGFLTFEKIEKWAERAGVGEEAALTFQVTALTPWQQRVLTTAVGFIGFQRCAFARGAAWQQHVHSGVDLKVDEAAKRLLINSAVGSERRDQRRSREASVSSTLRRRHDRRRPLVETRLTRDVGAAVRHGQPAEVVPRFDLGAARPQLLAGLPIERVQRGLARVRHAARRPGAETAAVDRAAGLVPRAIGHDLARVLAGRIREDDAVGDDGFLREIHVTREPGGRELPRSAALFERECRDASACGPAMLDRGLELGTHGSPERREHPLRTFLILPRAERPPDALRIKRLRVVANDFVRSDPL